MKSYRYEEEGEKTKKKSPEKETGEGKNKASHPLSTRVPNAMMTLYQIPNSTRTRTTYCWYSAVHVIYVYVSTSLYNRTLEKKSYKRFASPFGTGGISLT